MIVFYQGPRMRRSTEIRLDRRVQSAFARLEGRDGNVPSKGVYKIRAGEQNPLRVLARRLVEAREAGVSPERILEIVDEVRSWAESDLLKRAAS